MAREDTQEAAIRNTQRYLNQLSYFDADIPSVVPSGRYDNSTRQSLIAFQRKNGIPQSGYGDKQTLDMLYPQYKRSVSQNTPPKRLAVFPRFPKEFSISEGDTGAVTLALNFILNELDALIDIGTSESLDLGGGYSKRSADAVKNFQRLNLMEETGVVDIITWNLLAELFNRLFEKRDV